MQLLSILLWAAYGINRNDGGCTAPSALNAQEIDVFLALPDGAYRYDAPLDLIYVADYTRINLVSVGQRESYASVAAGAITQNVYLFAASNDLAAVIRAWIDRAAIAARPAGFVITNCGISEINDIMSQLEILIF